MYVILSNCLGDMGSQNFCTPDIVLTLTLTPKPKKLNQFTQLINYIPQLHQQPKFDEIPSNGL